LSECPKERKGERSKSPQTPVRGHIPAHPYDLANALLFRVEEAIANFIRAAYVERRDAQNQNVRIHFLGDDLRSSQLLPNEVDFFGVALRGGSPQP